MAFLIHPPEVSSVSDYRRETPPAMVMSNSNPTSVRTLSSSKTSKRVRVRICSRIKDMEPSTLSNSVHNVRLYGQFSASSLKQSKEDEEEKHNFYVNMGDAIRTIREEFPDLFYRELSFDIYRDDIVFKDPINTFVGIENYKSIFWALRFNGKIFFKALWVDIISVWQPVENMIMIRWTVHGIPRVPWESRGRFDGTSEYKLDKHGKIFEHRVHNIALNAPPKFQVLAVDELIQSLGYPNTPKPTYFKISPAYARKLMLSSDPFGGIGHYLASILAIDQESEVESSRRM
ncbi:hypothetical protein LguiB_023716 [Lonicera macranthoides]